MLVLRVLTVAFLALAAIPLSIQSAAPPLRDEVNLAGAWTGGEVPHLTGGQGAKTWSRSFTVPSNWTGKKIFIDLETVNFSPVTSIDGVEVGRITGSWLPHSHDITARVTPGQTHTVSIVASGTCPSNWPAGFNYGGNNDRWAGLIHDVYLRAYGMVAIRDAEVITSVTNKTITVKYDVQNFSTSAKTVTVNAKVYPSTGGAAALTFSTSSTSFAAGERKTIQAQASWTSPNLWWPNDPRLYHLCSAVKDAGSTIDSQTVRFGFRECKIAGRYIALNGVRLNCRGESVEMSTQGYPSGDAGMLSWINMEKSVNANSIRFHVKPPTNRILAICDENGLLVMPEAALWQSGVTGTNETRNIWMPAFITHFRNHASVVHWSSNNECYGSETNIVQLTNVIHTNDGSGRPVWSEDVNPAGYETAGKHYPEGYENLPNPGNMYSTSWISQTKPQSAGEWAACCWVSGIRDAARFWHGTYSRAMRYNNVTVIHPYNYSSFIFSNESAAVTANLRNSFAPVALFDYGYDGLGIEPIRSNAYPSIAAGSTANRTFVVYNDEFTDNMVTVQVDVKSGSTSYASATKVYQVALGSHVEFPCSFQVPYVGGSTMDVVLTTRKGGTEKFSESRRFTVTGSASGTSSSTVTLGGGGIDPTTPYLTVSPAGVDISGTTGANVAGQSITVTNGGAGTLGTLTTRLAYGPGATGWITATPGGSGNARSIALTFGTSAITGGRFTAQLIVKSASALPDSIVVPITLSQTGPDLTPPTMLRASGTGTTVSVVFSEEIESLVSNVEANYTINNGISIANAILGTDNATVTLTVTPALVNGTTYTLTANNIKDRASPANTIAANSTIQFTAARTITKIRFYPRSGMAGRMNGGVFEGSTGGANGTFVALYTIAGDPTSDAWTEVTSLQNANLGFTAVRYNTSTGFGNVAEVEFYSGDVKLTGTPFGTPGTWGGSAADFTKAFDGSTSTFFDCSEASAHAGLVLSETATRNGFRFAGDITSGGLVVTIACGTSAMRLPVAGLTVGKSVVVSLYDVRGSRRASSTSLVGTGSALQVGIDGSHLPSGQYLLKITAGGQERMMPISIVQ